jgi:hypothetical protein
MKRPLITLLLLCVCLICDGQDLQYAKTIIKDLCSAEYKGRGYVGNGVNKAADYLEERFHQLRLRKFGNTYSQTYSFPVNTHPYNIKCEADKTTLAAGYDFLVDAGSRILQATLTYCISIPTTHWIICCYTRK